MRRFLVGSCSVVQLFSCRFASLRGGTTKQSREVLRYEVLSCSVGSGSAHVIPAEGCGRAGNALHSA